MKLFPTVRTNVISLSLVPFELFPPSGRQDRLTFWEKGEKRDRGFKDLEIVPRRHIEKRGQSLSLHVKKKTGGNKSQIRCLRASMKTAASDSAQ